MTIEEKARAYDEALERVKPLYEWAKKDDSPMWSTYEYLFPQLVESQSKDERIRKALIDGVRQIRCKNGVTQEQMLAYLEKQKEPHYTKRNALFDKCVKNCDPEVMKKVSDEIDEMLQKEQKPIKVLYIPKFRTGDLVRSSKNPRLTYKILSVGSMNELGNPEYEVEIFTDGKPDEPRNLKHIEIEKMDSWGELVEQKPVVTHGETYHVDTLGTQQVIAGKMPQKPTEWSKEDGEKLERVDDLLWMLDDYIGDDCSICEERSTRLREEIKNELCPFLKSLRPHSQQE